MSKQKCLLAVIFLSSFHLLAADDSRFGFKGKPVKDDLDFFIFDDVLISEPSPVPIVIGLLRYKYCTLDNNKLSSCNLPYDQLRMVERPYAGHEVAKENNRSIFETYVLSDGTKISTAESYPEIIGHTIPSKISYEQWQQKEKNNEVQNVFLFLDGKMTDTNGKKLNVNDKKLGKIEYVSLTFSDWEKEQSINQDRE